jgi:hypothetical protein
MFPRWVNYLLPLLIVTVAGGAVYAPAFVTLVFSPVATDVGYAPEQPIPYSHALHAGQLGIDCRYCHTTVEKAGFAAVPATQTCMNCHTQIRVNGPDGQPNNKLAALRESWNTGTPVEWVKIHDLPDYAYFNHSAHVNKGVGCNVCHGRVDRMEVVYQAETLSMSWCLDCHRQPEKYLRPADQVTNMAFHAGMVDQTNPDLAAEIRSANPGASQITQEVLGNYLKSKYGIKDHPFMTSCSTCHR